MLCEGNEALTFAMLNAIVGKCFNGLFTSDNSAVLQGKLRMLRQLLAFHDPELA